tara:strand:- start:585 stop:1487 length:903 start_codon:yes stop_codon:yes gene_type:complete
MPLYKYNIDYFKTLNLSNADLFLNEENKDVIDNITSKVSCQNYNKTPMFKKKDGRKFSERAQHKQFKPTKFFNNYTVFDNFINEFRTILNKITKNNYNEKRNALDLLLLNSIEDDIFENPDNVSTLQKIYFDILVITKLSDLFIELSLYLYDKYNIFKNIFDTQYNDYKKMMKSIVIINPDDDYEMFCMNNSKNDRIVMLTKFYLILINNKKYDNDVFNELSNIIVHEFKLKQDDLNKKGIIEELYKHLNILIEYEVKNENSDNCINFVRYIYSNYKKHQGISKKIIFKIMDLVEKYEII